MARPKNETPTMRLTVRNGRYYVRWWEDGAYHRISLQTDDLEEATKRLAEFMPGSARPEASAAAWKGELRTARRGLLGETRALLRLLELGAEVFVPWGHDHKADLIAVVANRPIRIQVKAATRKGARIFARAHSVTKQRGGYHQSILARHEADFLVAYDPIKDECYCKPVSGASTYYFSAEDRLHSVEQLRKSSTPIIPLVGAEGTP